MSTLSVRELRAIEAADTEPAANILRKGSFMALANVQSNLKSLVVTFCLLIAANGSVFAEEPASKVIAKIAGIEITERELALVEDDMGQQFAQMPEAERRLAVFRALLDIKMLAMEAEENGFANDPNFVARMAFTRSRTLHNRYFQEKVLPTISEEAQKERYDIEIKSYPVQREIRARHILVKTEEEARVIISELDGGADFAELAKEKSTGPTGPNGGDLDYFSQGQMVPEFDKAAFELEVGAYTKEPVKTQFGWHVILKEDERDQKPPAFEEVREQVLQLLAREKYLEVIGKARERFPVEVFDETLKPALEPENEESQ